MEKTNDAAKKIVSKKLVLAVLGVDLIITILWIIAKYQESMPSVYPIMRDASDLLRNLATFTGVVIAPPIIKNSKSNRKGTKQYSTSYGEEKLKQILKVFDSYPNYDEVVATIRKLLITRTENEFDSPYFDYVFELQKTDEDFVKVWNDYNFYFSNNKMNDSDKEYFNKLEKYIFIKIYNKFKQIK